MEALRKAEVDNFDMELKLKKAEMYKEKDESEETISKNTRPLEILPKITPTPQVILFSRSQY